MWAHNNDNNGKNRGAIFYFSLPLMTNSNKIQPGDSNEDANAATTTS